MNSRKLLLYTAPAVLAAALFVAPEPATACAPAPPRNKPVEVASESAIIVWDEEAKTQHFIRRASFQTEAQDFGFLVPTPTQPTLAEADNEAFDTLAKITAPEVVKQPAPSSSGCSIGCSSPQGAAMPNVADKAEPVRVLDEQRVAGYNDVVLEADDANALNSWLTEHGYEFSPALTEWADQYIKAKWKITAFKIAKRAPEEKTVGTSAVRMTFKTDRPFFPYREPQPPRPDKESQDGRKEPRRLLRVFFVSDRKAKGALGEEGAWPGKVVWSNKVEAADREKVFKQLKLPEKTGPAAWWLTEFEDHSSPRPGTDDVYFAAADDQMPVKRPPHIQYVFNGAANFAVYCALAAYVAVPRFLRRPWRRLKHAFRAKRKQ
jgi:hypothetical protein